MATRGPNIKASAEAQQVQVEEDATELIFPKGKVYH